MGIRRAPARSPTSREANCPLGLASTATRSRSIFDTKPRASNSSRSSRAASSGLIGSRPSAQRSMGGIDIVVTTAMVTMVVKRSWLRTPIESPIVATMTSVEPRAFMPQPSASDSAHVIPPSRPPKKAPLNLPRLAIAIIPKVRKSRSVWARTARLVVSPANPKKTGMNSATMRPRSCSSMCRVRIGDWPTRMPATKAPSTVCTPIALVISAITPVATRIAVMTGSSLMNLSFAQRMSRNTRRRPMVKLRTRKIAVPSRLWASEARSIPPCSASPKVTDMMIQPIVSSMIAAATITWPTVRRRKPTSRTTIATIFTDEIDSAVPRNSAVINRFPGSGSIVSGSISPKRMPQRNGTAIPAIDTLTAALRERRTTDRSVSIPVSRSSSRIPSCATASIIAFWSGLVGNRKC